MKVKSLSPFYFMKARVAFVQLILYSFSIYIIDVTKRCTYQPHRQFRYTGLFEPKKKIITAPFIKLRNTKVLATNKNNHFLNRYDSTKNVIISDKKKVINIVGKYVFLNQYFVYTNISKHC